MKALIMNSDRTIEVTEQEKPSLGDDEVLIEVSGCGICGTDLHVYKGMGCTWSLPGIVGHEFAGTVIETGQKVNKTCVGDRVTVQPLVNCGTCESCTDEKTNLCPSMYLIGGERSGAMAEYVAVPEKQLINVPENIPLEYAALSEPAATAVHAVRRLGGRHYKNAIILGAGAIGLLTMSVLRQYCDTILVSDVDASRLEKAKELGADFVINPKECEITKKAVELTSHKFDLVVDAAGFSVTRKQGFSVIKPGGDFLFIALGDQLTEVDFAQLVTNELSFFGTQCHTMKDFHIALDLMSKGVIDYQKIVTVLPLEKGAEAFANPHLGIKLVLKP